MSSQDFENAANKAQNAASDFVDEAGRRVRRESRAFAARSDATSGKAKEALNRAADQARAAASSAADVYADVRHRAQAASERLDPFIRENPYAALGLAVIGGMLIGGLVFARGPRIVRMEP